MLRQWLRHLVDVVPVKLDFDGKTKITDVDGNAVYDPPIQDVRCYVSGRRVRIAQNVERIELSDGEILFAPDQPIKIDDKLQNPRDRVKRPLNNFDAAVVVQSDDAPHPDRGPLLTSVAYMRR